MSNRDWVGEFRKVYDHAVKEWAKGNRKPKTCFKDAEISFLKSIGAQPGELLDYAEDAPEIPFETALLISSARRDYFLFVQDGNAPSACLPMSAFPPKDAEWDGIRWLPRLLRKAGARLRGELPSELMYGCGGDRAFFHRFDIHAADFLRLVWMVNEDRAKILSYVKARAAAVEAR